MRLFRPTVPREFFDLFLRIGIPLFLAITTIMGGLLAWGRAAAFGAFFTAILIALAAYWLSNRKLKNQPPSALELRGYAYPPPPWLLNQEKERNEIQEQLKAALLLLMCDRTESGFWGRTYLYRRAISKSGLPLSGGSLTGTPLALLAVASSIEVDTPFFRDWAHHPLSQTLSRSLSPDGNYILEYRLGTVQERVPIFEPLRHAAGGLLAAMLFGTPGPRDLETLRLLCTAPLENVGWTKAVVFRALLHASYFSKVPIELRRIARRRSSEALADLIHSGEESVSTSQIWADPYNYGTDTKNQWMTLGTILPAMAVTDISEDLRSSLEQLIRRFLFAQHASVPADALLPSSFDKEGRGVGTHVFGTAIAVVAWRALALYAINKNSEDDVFAQETLRRLMVRRADVLEMPSIHPDTSPTSLEGYFAWAGFCLVAASVGVHISLYEFKQVVSLVETLQQGSRDASKLDQVQSNNERVIKESNLFSPPTVMAIVRSTHRIMQYYSMIDQHATKAT